MTSDPAALTPVERHGGYLVKRDDLFALGGQAGGKVRTCLALAQQAQAAGAHGLISAGARASPQAAIVAQVAQQLGLGCRIHCPAGAWTPELWAAHAAGAVLVQHRPGYNTVIVARARTDAAERGWAEVPFGMETPEAVRQTAGQVAALAQLPEAPERIVVPIGSGMSTAGLLAGLAAHGMAVPVLGVVVGADPARRLQRYAPGWQDRLTLVRAGLPYERHAARTRLGSLELDPVYEAKVLPLLRPGDLLWVVGRRGSPAIGGGCQHALVLGLAGYVCPACRPTSHAAV